jgi:HlyD family secretion protein
VRCFICLLGCCLLAVVLSNDRSVLAAGAATQDFQAAAMASPSPAAESKAAEKAKEPEKAKGAEEAKKAEKAKQAERAKKAEKAKEPEKAKGTEEAKKPAAPKPATHTVKKEPLKIEVTLDGVFEAQKMAEISLDPEVWTMLTVLSAVEHGTQVKQGDVLVSLDREKIDRAIADQRKDNEEADLALKLAEQQLATLEKSTPMSLATGERAQKELHEDLDYYFKVGRPMELKSAEFSLKWAQENFEYQQEELRQLEKMYQADDLTEETEEIILKRARNALARAKFYLEESKVYYDRSVKVLIPRDDVDIREAAKRLDLLWNQTRFSLRAALKQQRLALEKLKVQQSRSEEKLKQLVADRAAMIVKAPMAGVVYYGRCVQGKFSGGGSMSTMFRPGSSLAPKQVFMTIVKPRPMFIRTSVAEKQLHQVRAGLKGTAVPTGYPEMKLTVIVERVDSVPTGAGSFDSRITVALDDKAEALMPGMTCDVKLVSYENKEALTIPPNYLKTDEADPEKHYVYVLGKKGKSKKQYVTVGKRTATKVEILKGLSEGDQVLLQPPKEEKPPKEKKKPPKEEKKPPKEEKKPSQEKQEKKESPQKDKDNAAEKK